MASSFPTSLDSFVTTRANGTANNPNQADDHNNYADAINKIEAELGTDPSGTGFSTVKARLDAINLVTVTTQSGTTYTLALADAGTTIEFTSASAVTLTIPTNASVAFVVGTAIEIAQYGAGIVTVAPAGGVTMRSPGARTKLAAQYATAYLRKRATDEWWFEGDIST